MGSETLGHVDQDGTDLITGHFAAVQRALAVAPVAKIAQAVAIVDRVRRSGGCLYLCGNDGSAASVSHAACDLDKIAYVAGQRRLRATTLVDNVAVLSAYGNDDGYANIFKHQIADILSPGDALIGVSVSGASENVLLAMEFANSVGAKTIGVSGAGTERMRRAADLMIEMPGATMQVVEDAHMVLLHALSLALRARQLP
jgi:D-sedoheptulose 7-phosphate isomerase